MSNRKRSRLLYSWAEADAEGVYDEALTLPRQFQTAAVADALSHISKNSPLEAIRLARTLETRELRTSARDAIVHGWRSSDAKSAFEWLMENGLDVQAQRDKSLWRTTFSMYLDEDYGAAREYVDQYEGEFRDQLLEATAEHLVEWDLTEAIDYIKNVDIEVSEWFLLSIADSLTRLNPMEALSYGETIEPHRRNDFYESVIYTWSNEDFISLYENIERFPGKHRSLAATRILDANGHVHYLTDQEIEKLESMID